MAARAVAKVHRIRLLLSHRLVVLPLDVVFVNQGAANKLAALDQLVGEIGRFVILFEILNFLLFLL